MEYAFRNTAKLDTDIRKDRYPGESYFQGQDNFKSMFPLVCLFVNIILEYSWGYISGGQDL